jgi:hypothetical protein
MKLRSLFAFLVLGVLARAEVQIERTLMPFDAGPSSFAIGLPGGVNFCFDAVRGGLSYAWTGGFVDITSVRPGMGKKITPVTLLGPVVYRESGNAPLRRGDPVHPPVVDFKGYTLHAATVEFRYTIDGLLVREEISARPDGTGLVRRFTVENSAGEKWWYAREGQPPAALTFESTGSFTLAVPFGKATP